MRATPKMLISARRPQANEPPFFVLLATVGGFFGGLSGLSIGLNDFGNREIKPESTALGRISQCSYEALRIFFLAGVYTTAGAAAGAFYFGAFPISLPALVFFNDAKKIMSADTPSESSFRGPSNRR